MFSSMFGILAQAKFSKQQLAVAVTGKKCQGTAAKIPAVP
jgi:hypothetical protein